MVIWRKSNTSGRARRPVDHVVGQWVDYYNTIRSHMNRGHLPPIREIPENVPKLDRVQIVIRSYVGGLVKSFERKAG
jgi:putative transposase